MIYLYLLLGTSLILNLLFIIYDVFPILIPQIKRKLEKSKPKARDEYSLENLILKASLSLIKCKSSMMVWNKRDFYSSLYYYFFTGSSKEFKNYNYPRGFLLYGLTEYLMAIDNKIDLSYTKKIFDRYYIDNNGKSRFSLNKVDQVPFGITALNLYKVYNEEKYKFFFTDIYQFILSNYTKNHLVRYREQSKNELNDTIGMIVPFLVRYHKHTNDAKSLEIANEQMTFFIKYGVDHKTFLPSHGINLETKIKVGSSNWGRGIGWYFIGLKEMNEYNGSYKIEYEGICKTIRRLKNNDDSWGEFPGSNNNFDASTTTMFIYSLPKKEYSHKGILKNLDKYISKKGVILQTTGDAEGLNSYSKFSGKSELSQGFLMLILSRYVK